MMMIGIVIVRFVMMMMKKTVVMVIMSMDSVPLHVYLSHC